MTVFQLYLSKITYGFSKHKLEAPFWIFNLLDVVLEISKNKNKNRNKYQNKNQKSKIEKSYQEMKEQSYVYKQAIHSWDQ